MSSTLLTEEDLSPDMDLDLLEDEFEEYAAECRNALDIVLARIQGVRRSIKRSGKRDVICSVEDRVKGFASTIDKCDRRGYPVNIEGIRANVRDVGGIRIITPFEDDVYSVVMILHHIPGVNITDERDYVSDPKENGYRGYHMHVLVEIYSPIENSTKLVPLEIQVRDKAMDLWAAIEHIVGYKKEYPDPRARELFKLIGENLVQFDRTAIKLRDYAIDTNDVEGNIATS